MKSLIEGKIAPADMLKFSKNSQSLIARNRIGSIDLLKGLVMIIMALDHTRDYFHNAAFHFDPLDPEITTAPIFFTRWITSFCAPAFSFLAGLSAFLSGTRRTPNELSVFLLTRGIWLVFIELVIVNFGWTFNIHFNSFALMVIWSLGISMIVLAALIHLPRKFILIFSCLLIFFHNLLDNIHFPNSILWAIIHEFSIFKLSDNIQLDVVYPLIPWIGIMSMGYYFGPFYDKTFDSLKRKKILNIIGFSAIGVFIVLRFTNFYGDPSPWKHYDTFMKDIFSILNTSKYPPSLLFLLMTLGPSFIFLANSENLKGKIVDFFSVFGRVPFFYYILHIYLIHIIAMGFALASGFGWQKLILTHWITVQPGMNDYGYGLWVVYLVWIGVIMLLYPFCKKFAAYKLKYKEKKWLSYL